jgi:endonuclease G
MNKLLQILGIVALKLLSSWSQGRGGFPGGGVRRGGLPGGSPGLDRRLTGCLLLLAGLAVVALGLCLFLGVVYGPALFPPAAAPPSDERGADGRTPDPPAIDADYPHLRWGLPGPATRNPADKDHYLMTKPYFALSYNSDKGTPNWVSWRLVREDLADGPNLEKRKFEKDPDLPGDLKVVETGDYGGSGFDRGHMCPFADRSRDPQAAESTCRMTNIVPQSNENNAKGWNEFEMYCRGLARQGKELYIVCGPAGQGGEGSKGPKRTIGWAKHIVVPAQTWKVAMVLDRRGSVEKNLRLIAVIMPNDQTVDNKWGKYRVPVEEVEKLTGYTFFDKARAPDLSRLKLEADRTQLPPPEYGDEDR